MILVSALSSVRILRFFIFFYTFHLFSGGDLQLLAALPFVARFHPCASRERMAGTETSLEAQELRGDIERSTAAIDEQQRLVATLLESVLELRDIFHRPVVYFLNHITPT